jgi:hypothetical protein
MPLNNTQLRYYDYNVLRLPKDKRTEYNAQVDRLIDNLRKNVRDKTEIKITKVVKAGSFAKHTILRKTTEDPVDVDVVFYISGKDATVETIETLTADITKLLEAQYPNKSVEDFTIQSKAATVAFVASGLSVDIVPVIQDEEASEYGWQYDIRDGSKTHTCAPCQVNFVYKRKQADPDFRTLVRLGKRWSRRAEVKGLKSFHVELLMAHLQDTLGKPTSIEQRFRDFLLYIAQSELKQIVSFPENGSSIPNFSHPVVIVDPVCDTNNVASRISEAERKAIVEAAREAWETANFASIENDDAVWKELFGPKFRTEDQ